jgi:hypothetical protein
MDPSFYRNMTMFYNKGPDQSNQAAAMEQQPDHMDESSGSKSAPPDTNWSVYGPDASRGNLRDISSTVDDNDPRMRVGWASDSNSKPKGVGEMGWMSSRDQQPLLWSMGDDEA